MTPEFSSELLSAFIDGELSDEQRVVVEQRLAESSELRAAVDELRTVSRLVDEIPRESAPQDLAESILSQVQSSQPVVAASSAPRKHGWLWPAAVTLTSAAGLMIMLRGNDRPVAEMRTDETMANTSAAVESADFDVALPAASDAIPMTASPMNMAAAPEESAAGLDSSLFVDLKEQLKDPEIGQVVQAVQRSGQEVTIVKLRVVDFYQGLEQLEVLLIRNEIPPTPSYGELDDASIDDGGDMVAVYVETTPDRLAQVLRQMHEEDQIQSLEFEPPELASYDRQQFRGYADAPVGVNSAASDTRAARVAPSFADTDGAAERAEAESDDAAVSERILASRQRKLVLPERTLKRSAEGAYRTARVPSRKAELRQQEKSAAKTVQVLIVVEPSSAGAGQPHDNNGAAQLDAGPPRLSA